MKTKNNQKKRQIARGVPSRSKGTYRESTGFHPCYAGALTPKGSFKDVRAALPALSADSKAKRYRDQ